MSLKVFGLVALLAIQWIVTSDTACAVEAQVVVVVGDGQGGETKHCVEVGAESVDGLEALRSTGIDLRTKSFGGSLGEAVCSIGEVGRDRGCPSGSGYWHYWTYKDGHWTSSELGPSSTTVRPGAHQAWIWTEGQEARPPKTTSFECPARGFNDLPELNALSLVGGSIGVALLAIPILRMRRQRRRAD